LLIPGRNRRGHTVKNWHFDAVAPAGGLVSSLKDIVKFIGFHLSPDDDWRESVNLCLSVHHRMSASQAIGLGWHLHRDRISGEEVWWHNGATGGYRSFVGIVLSHRLGVAVLNNCGPFGWRVKNLTTLGFQILRFAMKLDW
jgi:CubicO group peptidase (beta-lactamase class C family)